MKKLKTLKTAVTATLAFAFIATGVARASDYTKDIVSVKPKAGIFIPRGEGLDNAALAGAQIDWSVAENFGLRLGYEYAKADVSDGSSLTVSRVPVIFTTVPRKRSDIFKKFYMGFGGVFTTTHYSDGHYPDVNKFAPAVLIGWKLSKHFSAEAQYDQMKRYGRNYGGISLSLTYGGF